MSKSFPTWHVLAQEASLFLPYFHQQCPFLPRQIHADEPGLVFTQREDRLRSATREHEDGEVRPHAARVPEEDSDDLDGQGKAVLSFLAQGTGA